MPRKWYNGHIIEIKQESPNTKLFYLKIDDEIPFEFRAGQFITMDLPIGDKRFERWRSYSIANAPNKDNILEFCVVRTDPGFATKYLFDEIETGHQIKFKGPEGNFCLPSNLNKEIVMICTGTGIAPFRSMISNITQTGESYSKLHLIFGTRYKEGILYFDELSKLEKEDSRFEYSIALSREEEHTSARYVHDIYKADYSKTTDDILFYLCGWQNMVDEARENLLNLGYKKEQIIQELYG